MDILKRVVACSTVHLGRGC